MYKYFATCGLLLALCLLPTQARTPYKQTGIASWYGYEVIGKLTASGALWDPRGLTGASWYAPFGTKLKVTHLVNGKSVVVRINDRGPSKRLRPRRIIDLSQAAAIRLGMKNNGIARVLVEEIR